LFRNKVNVGEFADLPVTMNLKTVRRMAKEAEIGFSGIKLNIVRDPSLKGRGWDSWGHTTLQFTAAAGSRREIRL
jgi:hypothetical protein